MTKSLKNVNNEKCTLKDLEYGDKTKEAEELKEWVGAHKTLLSWKLDGLTIVLTEKCTLKDLEYGEKTENHRKLEIHTLGCEIWQEN